jgi:PIN domain nuclease of toxin-antitoxin system
LKERHREAIVGHRDDDGLAVSAISCWEVAKLVEYGRLELTLEVGPWMREALRLPGLSRIELTPRIAVASTQLPGSFHSDPADQIIAATARVHDLILATEDCKIRAYDHITTV